ncbi:lysine--tRNA ligase, partial [Mycobacterium tuberculosis]
GRASRTALQRRGGREGETPGGQTGAGGAAARPGATQAKARDSERDRRSAPERGRKRGSGGGGDKGGERKRGGRNEGAEATQAPEGARRETDQTDGTEDEAAGGTRE